MARLVLTEPGEDVDVGGNVTVIGTVAPGEVITVIRGNVILDPSFNAGGDTVRLPGIASDFTVRLSGSTVILTGTTASVTIPVGPAGMQVSFDDVSRTLVLDQAGSIVRLGDQTVTSSETGVLPFGATAILLGTEGADTLNGTTAADVIDGLGGNDIINGLAGDDFIRGGLGDDTLTGGLGDDEIYGGVGNDRIIDDEGAYAVLDGGVGNDRISVNNLAITALNISGGEGDDILELTLGNAGLAFVNAGGGADRVTVSSLGLEVSLQLGTGRDELVIPAGALGTGNFGLVIARDFEAGANGDKVNLANALSGFLQNYTAGSNPFASGHLRLVDIFGNAFLEIDRDGPGGAGGFKQLINFAGVGRDALTADNFSGFDPRASAAATSAAASGSVTLASASAQPDAIAEDDRGFGEIAYVPDYQPFQVGDHGGFGGYFFLA
jgi:Ca2+-binding RTX toxin-like protein